MMISNLVRLFKNIITTQDLPNLKSINEQKAIGADISIMPKIKHIRQAANKFEKRINTYFIQSDKQRYNYDMLIEKPADSDIMIHCDVGEELLGTALLKVDARKNQQPNQTISVMNSKKQKIATIDCSLKKIQKVTQKPPITIEIIQGVYTDEQSKVNQKDQQTQSFIVLKYGDANYQTKLVKDTIDRAPVWKQTFHSGVSYSQRIFVEVWKKLDKDHNKFQGLALIDIMKSLNTQKDYEINFDKKKRGTIKIAIYEDKGDKKQVDVKINDKNITRKRTIKAYIVETLLKDPSRKGAFIRLLSSDSGQKFQTTHQFTSSKELNFNEGFTFVVNENEEIQAHFICNQGIQQEIARASIKVKDIVNKSYEMKLMDVQDKEIGTLYLQFYDQEIDIKEEISQNKSEVITKPEQKADQEPVSMASKVSQKTLNQLGETAEQMKARYSSRQSIHDYMNELNAVLQQGLLKVAKQRPQNPIKQLGLYLINYKKS